MAETNTLIAERLQTRSAEQSLRNANTELAEITKVVDGTFEKENRDPKSVHPEAYWRRTAAMTKQMAEADKSIDPDGAIQLTASMPYYLFAQQRLDHIRDNFLDKGRHLDQDQEKQFSDLLLFVSHYNSLLRKFASKNEDITAPMMNEHLMGTLIDARFPHAEKHRGVISDVIRGAQHELAFQQILEVLGRVRTTSPHEDLQGIDYVWEDPVTGEGVPINVKASPNSVWHMTNKRNRICGLANSGIVVSHSMVTDEDLGGYFYVSQGLAEKKAAALEPLLLEASDNRFARRVNF